MIVFEGDRQTGKTHNALLWLHEKNTRYLLVANHQQAANTVVRYRDLFNEEPLDGHGHVRVVSAVNPLQNVHARRDIELGIDDLDSVLYVLLGGVEPAFATLTPRPVDGGTIVRVPSSS